MYFSNLTALKDSLPYLNKTTAKENGFRIKYPHELKNWKTKSGVRISYIDEGKKNEPALFFIHGIGSAIPVWSKMFAILKEKYRCIAVDLPGHGFSSKDSFEYSIKFYADVLLELLEELNIDEVALIGHSMGAQIAVTMALRDENPVSKLVLIAPSGIEPYYAAERQLIVAGAGTVSSSGLAYANNDLNYVLGFNYDFKKASELLAQLLFYRAEYPLFARTYYNSVTGIVLEPINDKIKQLKTECLLMVGDQDVVSPYNYLRMQSYVSLLKTFARKIPNEITKVVPKAGHFLPYQCPELVCEEIENFLEP